MSGLSTQYNLKCSALKLRYKCYKNTCAVSINIIKLREMLLMNEFAEIKFLEPDNITKYHN